MAAPKKNAVVREVEQTFKTNYEQLGALPFANEADANSYRKAAVKHVGRIEAGNYSADSLILEAVYDGLGNGDRDRLVEAAAILIAVVNGSDVPEVEPEVEVDDIAYYADEDSAE